LISGCAGQSAGRAPQSVTPPPAARPGIEVLLSDSLHLVRGRRVGLVTNQSGVDSRGVSDVELLRGAGVNLVALFSPEHGFRGTAAPGAAIASSIDSATGLPIYSLYGRNSSPTDSMLAGIDLLLVDLQDAGARYFTYLYTTVEVMRAAARRGVPVLVLDRPDPIGGMAQGNILDTAYASPVGMLAIPMRHGMTLGELARLARSDLAIAVELEVIPVASWRRTEDWDATGLPFIPPSPNLRTVESLYHYPGLCLFEATALSVGRGSASPFEQVGAPWLDTAAVLARLRDARLEGVAFQGVSFTPRDPGDGKYADTLVTGIRFQVTDRRRYDPTRTAVTLLAILQASDGARLGWSPARFDRLAGGPSLRTAIVAGASPDSLIGAWAGPRAAFENRRRPFLLYPSD
jgi:uncharacterized protein YbbC (DUF1343 family)